EGKSGGYRSVILFRSGDKAFFVFGFAKSARANISRVEERDFKDLSKEVFSLSETTLQTLIKRGAFVPVKRDEKSKNL
ncbi:type II toxin-antitoxin system RelE/ParE family toxin, partial [Prosthecochloris sp. ZM_2]